MSADAIVGRESQKEALARFLDDVQAGPSALVLEGEPGIGKSVLWTKGVDDARRRGYGVLRSRPTGSDSELAFVALGDLLDASAQPFLDHLPEPQRHAVEIALFRRHRTERAPDPRSAAVGILAALTWMAEEAPTIVAIDEVQWIDPATARLLTFTTRRLSDQRLGFLLARPTMDERPPLGLADALPAGRLHLIGVGPLAPHEIGVIVRGRTGVSLSRPETGSLAELSGGNPFYALEIARAQARGDQGVTGQRMPIPKSLREDLVLGRVGSVSSKTRDMLLVAASMARPTLDGLRMVLPAGALDATLQPAIDAGLIEVLGLDVRFAHPLYRSAIYADASRRRRHETHRRLAETADDAQERARHLALSAEAPDVAVAEEAERAATSARDRGAPDGAAELLEHAIRLTPRDDPRSLRQRLLLAAHDFLSGGNAEGARARAREALRISTPGSEQADSLRQIAAIELAIGALAEARLSLEEALARVEEEGGLTAEIHRELARVAIRAGEMSVAERHIVAALEIAERYNDRALARAIATTAAEVDLLLAKTSSSLTETLNEGGRESFRVSDSPELISAQAEVLAGHLDRAEGRLDRLLLRAGEQGDEPGRLLVTTKLAELKIRSGAWEPAEMLANQARELAIDLGVSSRFELGLVSYALAGRGRTDDARALAAEALVAAEGDRPTQLWCLAALGFLELSLARFPEALRQLGQARSLLAETGIADPCAFPFLADEAEVLIAVGETETAWHRIATFEEIGERLDRDLVRGQAFRVRGLALAAEGDIHASLSALERSVEIHERVGIPMELGRTLLALGTTRRRDRQKRPAREVLQRALEAFTVSGAVTWADRAREELAKISGRRTAVGDLTDSESRVARLAAAGMTNREIARTLSMSVRTVEGHLSHVYAKLELRSRTELAVFFQATD